MLTIPRNQKRGRGDYPADCDYCGVRWMRSAMRLTGEGLLACPDETGLEAQECVEANRELEWQPDISLDKDRGTAHGFGEPVEVSLVPEYPTLSVAARNWWRPEEGLTAEDDNLESWTDAAGGLIWTPAPTVVTGDDAIPPVETVAALGGYTVPYFNEDNGDDELWTSGPASNWNRLHNAEGMTFWLAFKPTLGGGSDCLFRTIETNPSGGSHGGVVCYYTLETGVFSLVAFDSVAPVSGHGNVILDDDSEEGIIRLQDYPSPTPSLGGSSLVVVVAAMKRSQTPYAYDRIIFLDGCIASRNQKALDFDPVDGTSDTEVALRVAGEGRGNLFTGVNPMRGYFLEFGWAPDFLPERERFGLAHYLSRKFKGNNSPV